MTGSFPGFALPLFKDCYAAAANNPNLKHDCRVSPHLKITLASEGLRAFGQSNGRHHGPP